MEEGPEKMSHGCLARHQTVEGMEEGPEIMSDGCLESHQAVGEV